MDIQLQELLDKIKREGVEAAKAEAARIVAEGESRKKAILEEASREAKALADKAAADARRAEESGKAALAQASRDLLLGFKDRVQALLDALVKDGVAGAYGPGVLAECIPAAVKSLAAGGDFDVLVGPATLRALEGSLAARLAAELGKGVELKPHPDLDAGFRVTEKSGAAYYDFSAEAVAELLSRHLNARLAETLRGAAKGM